MCVCLYSPSSPPCSEVLKSDEEQGRRRGECERDRKRRRKKRVDLASACSRDKLHSEWADTLLKYA